MLSSVLDLASPSISICKLIFLNHLRNPVLAGGSIGTSTDLSKLRYRRQALRNKMMAF